MENKELKEKFIDERTGIEYRLVGDYYIPNITIPKARRTGNFRFLMKNLEINVIMKPIIKIRQRQLHNLRRQ